MATIEFNNEKSISMNFSSDNKTESINASLSPEPSLNTKVRNLNYIPDYKKYEEERQNNEFEREAYINELKQRVLNGEFKGERGEQGPAGTTKYTELTDKPKINNVELNDNKTSNDLGLQELLDSGVNIKTINNKSILGEGNIDVAADMTALTNIELEEILNRNIEEA